MFKDITLGQYYPGDSVVHRLDPRTKIVLMIAYIAVVFAISEMWLFSVAAAFVVFTAALSRLPFSYLWKSLKPLKWVLVFMFVLNVFTIKTGKALVDWWVIKITVGGVLQALFVLIRLTLLVAGTSLMTLTTTPIALTDGLEKLLSPFKRIGFPAHELAMMMTIALRFIPTLLEEADKIMKAQLSRGADFETGGLVKRAKSMIPIIVPLFVSAFRRADELAMAMESRCYHGGEGRTRMKQLKFCASDGVAALLVFVMLGAIIAVQAVWY
ncbi:MAG TPA: energy-coupling factor transporter transmembrane component T [Clostridia bacterium]|nr:energy-coupling factor transporter transmembrane component T [Clostridia bacterium]